MSVLIPCDSTQVRDALRDLCEFGVDEECVVAALLDGGDTIALAEWHFALARSIDARALEYWTGEVPVAVIVPHVAAWRELCPAARAGEYASLSAHARVRVDAAGRGFVIESPFALASVELQPCALPVVARLGRPTTRDDVERQAPDAATARATLDALARAGLLASEGDERLTAWTHADAQIHARSRAGRGTGPIRRRVASRRLAAHAGEAEGPTASRPIVGRADTGLFDVLAKRTSRRDYAPRPLNVGQLSSLLAGSFAETAVDGATSRSTRRPYPSGGAIHALDPYVAITNCDGLEAGLYRFEPRAGVLSLVASGAVAAAMVVRARRAASRDDAGQALLALAADLDAVVSAYEGIAYSLLLKEVGAAMQTVQLVAEAIGIAACPVGSGDSEAFSRALGSDFFRYTTVGEVLIGSRPVSESAS